MSAFIVDPAHIQAIVRFALTPDYQAHIAFSYYSRLQQERIYPDATELGQLLTDANVESVSYRYNRPSDPIPFTRDAPFSSRPIISAVQCIKACDCLAYQSCEHPGWDSSDANAALQAIKHEACKRLPDYDDAAWEITD